MKRNEKKKLKILVLEQRLLQTDLELILRYSTRSERKQMRYRGWCWLGM